MLIVVASTVRFIKLQDADARYLPNVHVLEGLADIKQCVRL